MVMIPYRVTGLKDLIPLKGIRPVIV